MPIPKNMSRQSYSSNFDDWEVTFNNHNESNVLSKKIKANDVKVTLAEITMCLYLGSIPKDRS